MLKIGLVLLLLSFLIYAQAVKYQKAYNWFPTSTPLLLEQGKPTRVSFVADGDFEYNIELSFEKTNGFDALNSILQKMEKNVPFRIQVQEDGKPIDTDDGPGIGYSDTIILMPTSFQANSGRHYSVSITPKKSFPNLQVTKPQAQICVDHRARMPYVHRALFLVALAALFFLIGLGLTLVGWWRKR